MVKTSIIPVLKAACIGIGIIEVKEKIRLLGISGTGFIIQPDGFFLTAAHVIIDLNKEIVKLRKKGRKVRLGAAIIELKKDKITIHPVAIGERYFLSLEGPAYFGPKDFDVALGRLIGTYKIPCLNIKKPTKLDVFTEIMMCGYPGGNTTLNLRKEYAGVRTSPILQTGRISSLMPADNTDKPVGIQTDIIGTGGSSGSPIVDAEDGEVIGIAQNVVQAEVLNKKDKYMGLGKIGLIWGVSNFFLAGLVQNSLTEVRKQLDDKGLLKPEYKKRPTARYKIKVEDLEKLKSFKFDYF